MKNIVIIEHNSPKEFLFEYCDKKGYSVYVVTNKSNDVYEKYPCVKDQIITDVYDIQTSTDNVLAYIKKNALQIDAVGTFSEDLVILTADLSSILGCKSIGSLPSRVTSCNKLAMRMKLSEDDGIRQPKYTSFNIFEDSESVLRSFPKPCVIKPVFGIASHGVVMIEDNNFNLESLKKDILSMVNEGNRAPFKRFAGNMLLEEFVRGRMMSFDGFVYDDEVTIVGSLEFVMGDEPYFTQKSSYIPARTSESENSAAREYVTRVIKKLGFQNSPFHAEIRYDNDGPVLIEIAGRMAGGTIHKSYDKVYNIDMIDMMFKCWLGERIVYSPEIKGYNYHCFFYPEIKESKIVKNIQYPNIDAYSEVYFFEKKAFPGYELITYPEMPNSVLEFAVFSESLDRVVEIKDYIENQIIIDYV